MKKSAATLTKKSRTENTAARRRQGRPAGKKSAENAAAARREELIRQSIVEASAKVFATNGYAATTMEEIASEAGFGASSLYSYFSSKEELYLFLLKLLSAKVTDIFDDPLLAGLPFFERVSWVLRRIFRLVEQTPELFEILFQGLRVGRKTSVSIVESRLEIERGMLRAFARQLEIGQEEGAVVQCDAEELACLLKGAFQAWLARWRSGDISSGLQESFPRFLKLIRPMLAGR